MNKYDKKLAEIAPKHATIYELTREDVETTSEGIADMFLGGLFRIGKLLRKPQFVGAFYLIINDKESDLVHIQRDLIVKKYDVTNTIQAASSRKQFTYDGYRYTLFQKK